MVHWIGRTSPLAISLVVGLMVNTGVSADRIARQIPEGATTRERFLNLLDRPRPPLEPRENKSVVEQGFLEQRFEFTSEPQQRVPGLLVKSEAANERSPVLIVLHGTGGNKESLRPLLRRIASHGIIAVAIDGRYAGERTGGGKGTDSYRAAIFATWQSGQGFPFLYDTVWDTLRLLDYLESRSDVDSKRIGGIGFSKGGTELYLAAAADTRIAAVVPCIGVQSFGWALEHDAWRSRISTIQSAVDAAAREVGIKVVDSEFIRRFYERVAPGIDHEFDGPVMLPLIAPRPMLVINGDRDDRTPRPGLDLCIEAARSAYKQEDATGQFEFILQANTGHAVTPQSEAYAIEWLMRQLEKPKAVHP